MYNVSAMQLCITDNQFNCTTDIDYCVHYKPQSINQSINQSAIIDRKKEKYSFMPEHIHDSPSPR